MASGESNSERELGERNRRLRLENLEHRARLAQIERERQDERKDWKGERERFEQKIKALESQLARALKTSATSSKRPSSDIVKAPRKRRNSQRKIGGQPGHPLHERTPFKPAEINGGLFEHTLSCCPDCRGSLVFRPGVLTSVQQMDIQPMPVRIEEHRAATYWCERCLKNHTAPLPPHIEKGGLCGPYLTTLIAYLKGACHASFSTIWKYLSDVHKIEVSRGLLSKLVAKVSTALDGPYAELLKLLPLQRILNVDETGHPEKGRNCWTWCFRAELFMLFKIDESRGSKVLLEVLGAEFDGTLGCDYFSAYRKYMKDFGVELQFCLAHLIRDVKFLAKLPDAATKAYGERLLEGLRALFGVIHQRESLGAAAFRERLEAVRNWILYVAGSSIPDSREARNMAARFAKHGASYFQFITTPGLEPTNNLAEQAIRFVVIDRLVTQGTRGEKGRRWCERIWTTLGTCALQATSSFDYLLEAIQTHFNNRPSPSLLSNNTS